MRILDGGGCIKLKENEPLTKKLYEYLKLRMRNEMEKSINKLIEIIESNEIDDCFDNQDRRFVIKELFKLCETTSHSDHCFQVYFLSAELNHCLSLNIVVFKNLRKSSMLLIVEDLV